MSARVGVGVQETGARRGKPHPAHPSAGPAADMRNDAPAQTRREKGRGGRQEPIRHPGPASPSTEPLQGKGGGRACRRLLESRMPTGRPHVSWAPASTHWALIIPASLHLPLDAACPSPCSPSSSQPSGLLNQSPRRGPEQRRPQPFGQLFRGTPVRRTSAQPSPPWVPQPLTR